MKKKKGTIPSVHKSFESRSFAGGNQASPTWFHDWGSLKCKKCKVKPKKIVSEDKFSSTVGWRGTLDREWKEIIVKCPKCGCKGKYNTEASESDGTYYSNEERRVYGD